MSVDGRLRNGLSHEAASVDADVDGLLCDVVQRGRRLRRLRRVAGVTITTLMIVAIVIVTPAVRDAIRDHSTQPAAPPLGSIEGTYMVQIERADTSGSGTRDLSGSWQFTLRGDGLLTAQGPAGATLSTQPTHYQVTGDRILTTAFASGTCSGVGVYRWSREGPSLSFAVVSDPCATRVALFTAHPWRTP
jgi:hypothetical protein